MKTNRRKYRTFSRHGDFLFTKREANKRNRKDVKKMLTNIVQYVIISISKEREVMIMRIDVSIICPFCRKDHAVEVNLAQYEAWQNGELIQNAIPYLTPTEREQLISGLCPKCQAEMFGE